MKSSNEKLITFNWQDFKVYAHCPAAIWRPLTATEELVSLMSGIREHTRQLKMFPTRPMPILIAAQIRPTVLNLGIF